MTPDSPQSPILSKTKRNNIRTNVYNWVQILLKVLYSLLSVTTTIEQSNSIVTSDSSQSPILCYLRTIEETNNSNYWHQILPQSPILSLVLRQSRTSQQPILRIVRLSSKSYTLFSLSNRTLPKELTLGHQILPQSPILTSILEHVTPGMTKES
jgi:hypothetical protein